MVMFHQIPWHKRPGLSLSGKGLLDSEILGLNVGVAKSAAVVIFVLEFGNRRRKISILLGSTSTSLVLLFRTQPFNFSFIQYKQSNN